MGQKTHPYGFRLGVVKQWRSRYYARRDFPELLKEDGGVRLGAVHAVPTATVNELGAGVKRNIQAVLIDEELVAIDERLSTAAPAERKELLERRKLASDRRARIASFLPPGIIDAAPDGGVIRTAGP